MIKVILDLICKKFNFRIYKNYPNLATRFAKKYFKKKRLLVCEVGSWKGDNAISMFKELNVRKMILIDPYEKYLENNIESEKSIFCKKAKSISRKRLFNYNVDWLYRKSDDAVKAIKTINFDFIYIDGNHQYDYVKKDLINYWKRVKPDGILAGDDFNNFGVAKAVIEFSKMIKAEPLIRGTQFIFIKRWFLLTQKEVLSILKENNDKYLTAREVTVLLKNQGIIINYNTVCKNLKQLRKSDLVLFKDNPKFKYSILYKDKV